jgi:nucleotide-binding universal stress UspA family protein
MFRRALICTDFSDGMYRLASFVTALAAAGFEQLIFFHNVPLSTEREIPKPNAEQIEARRQQLSQAIQNVPSGVEAAANVQCGIASDNILQAAKSANSDIIFLGTATRTQLQEKLFGSTLVQLIERTRVPLLILRPQLISTFTRAELDLRCRHLFRCLLVPYEGSAGGNHLLQQLKQQIQNSSANSLEQLQLLWVLDDSIRHELRGEQRQRAEVRLAQVRTELAELGVGVDTALVEGNPLEQILAAATAYDTSAIATSSRGLGGILKWSTPSVMRELLRSAWQPLLFYPRPEE